MQKLVFQSSMCTSSEQLMWRPPVSLSLSLRCVPECLMRLCDTHGEIRAAYSALLEVVPTHLITRLGSLLLVYVALAL